MRSAQLEPIVSACITRYHRALANVHLNGSKPRLSYPVHVTLPWDEMNLFCFAYHANAPVRTVPLFLRSLYFLGVFVCGWEAFGMKSMFRAIYDGDVTRVKALCAEQSFDVNARLVVTNGHETTALHAAVDYDYPEILRALAPFEPNLNVLDSKGFTPAGAAVLRNRFLCLSTLREMGADLCAPSRPKIVCERPPSFPDRPRFLETAPLHLAAKLGNTAMILWLLKVVGVDVEMRDSKGQTAAHHAALENQPDALRALADAGCDLRALSSHGDTPLLWACLWGNQRVVQFYVKEKGFTLSKREIKAAYLSKEVLEGSNPTGMNPEAFRDAVQTVEAALSAMNPEERRRGESLEKYNETVKYLDERTCAECQTVGALKVCTRCRTIRYCSRECQLKHWPTHKMNCEPQPS